MILQRYFSGYHSHAGFYVFIVVILFLNCKISFLGRLRSVKESHCSFFVFPANWGCFSGTLWGHKVISSWAAAVSRDINAFSSCYQKEAAFCDRRGAGCRRRRRHRRPRASLWSAEVVSVNMSSFSFQMKFWSEYPKVGDGFCPLMLRAGFWLLDNRTLWAVSCFTTFTSWKNFAIVQNRRKVASLILLYRGIRVINLPFE